MIERILYDEDEIRAGVARVAGEIQERFRGQELTMLVVLRGGIVFAADLVRRLDLPLHLDTIGVSSYRGTTGGDLRIISSPALTLAGRAVLIVDDILDSGRTMFRLREEALRSGARSVSVAVLLDKAARRQAPIRPDFAAFEVPDVWVVGYGLDHNERYRNLPYIAVFAEDGGTPEAAPDGAPPGPVT